MCYPNFTIVITNPDPGEYTHLFAVQNEGFSTATKCTVTPDDSYFVIDDCNATVRLNLIYQSTESTEWWKCFGLAIKYNNIIE